MWLFGKKQKIEGEIGYYHLEEWWLNVFSESERKYLEIIFKPLGVDNNYSLIKGNIDWTSQSAAGFLNGLAGWPKNEHEYLSEKIFKKAEELASDILDKHFCYSNQIEYYYRKRSNPEMMKKSIVACNNQINISSKARKAFIKDWGKESGLPSHKGYTQLAIIYYKQQKFEEAVKVCEQAQKQGWSGDWERRISRYMKKLENLNGN
jgi:tetratricopeptide (TPR) repeat protein